MTSHGDNEATILGKVRLAIAKYATVSRNNCGAYKSPGGHYIQYGVFSPGGSDLIGYRPITITPDMVGKTLAQFVALECKSAVGKASPEQLRFIEYVKKSGGLAGLVRSPDDALRLLGVSIEHKPT